MPKRHNCVEFLVEPLDRRSSSIVSETVLHCQGLSLQQLVSFWQGQLIRITNLAFFFDTQKSICSAVNILVNQT
ncbi:hypothetical protein HPP92_000579 [Vanilla planifolia]|uniref:Uncharacterized protein n=1 Tax=Vanilla planifolia TaxID=51239 RepID=A0A835SBF6_VANPL|nr:hypothetical protein HPP92_000579 [Vanilla planifolia]